MAQLGVKASRPTGAFHAVSRALGSMRWAFLPLGIFALLAVGIHGSADTVCDRLLWVADRIAEAFDHAMGTFDLTAPLVGAFSFAARTRVARALALVWELSADVVVALPALGFEDRTAAELRPEQRWRALLHRTFTRPTTLRVLRPLETLAFALAGTCAVAKMVQAELYLGLHDFLDTAASPLARFVALLALGAVGASLGLRALQRALEHADSRSELEARTSATRLTAGLLGSALVLPLALAALLDASPVFSFFR